MLLQKPSYKFRYQVDLHLLKIKFLATTFPLYYHAARATRSSKGHFSALSCHLHIAEQVICLRMQRTTSCLVISSIR